MKHKHTKIISLCLCFLLIFEQTGLAQVLPSALNPTGLTPPLLRYLSVNQANPFNYFNFLLDKGLSPQGTDPEKREAENTQILSEVLMKEIVLPAITQDINTSSSTYTPLRQIYHSLILAEWFKLKQKQDIRISGNQDLDIGKSGDLGQNPISQSPNPQIQISQSPNNPYIEAIDKGYLKGLESEVPWEKDTFYQQYLKSYSQGEYKLEANLFGLRRMYWSGGVIFDLSGGSAGLGSSPLTIITQKELENNPDLLSASPLEDKPTILVTLEDSAVTGKYGKVSNVIVMGKPKEALQPEGLSADKQNQPKAGASLSVDPGSLKTPEPPIPKNGNSVANEWLKKANRAAREGLLEEARDSYERALYNPFFGYTKIEGITNEGLRSIQERYDEILKIAGLNTDRSTQGITWKGRLNPLYRRLTEVLKEVRENAGKDTNDPLLVVDIGIGKGGAPTTFDLVDILRKSGLTNIKVIGVDNNPQYVYKAKNNLKMRELPEGTIEFREGNGFDLDTLGIKDMDLIIASNVLLDVYYSEKEQKAAIAKTLKNLSKDGILVTAEAPQINKVNHYTIYSKDGSLIEKETLPPEKVTAGSLQLRERKSASSALGRVTETASNTGLEEAKEYGGIDLSQIDLTLKDEKFVSSLNPAERQILLAPLEICFSY